MRVCNIYYTDLRKDDVFTIPEEGLAIKVIGIESGGKVRLRSNRFGDWFLKKGGYYYLSTRIGGIYNFGNRGHGKRAHIRVEFYKPGVSYVLHGVRSKRGERQAV